MPNTPPWLLLLGAALVLIALSAGGVVAVNYLSAAWMSSQNAQLWGPVLASAENTYGIPPGLLARIAYQESHFRQSVIDGTESSSAGALGIMQLEPADFASVNRPIPFTPQDTGDQITEAARELARLYRVYGDWTTAVAAYNDGQGNIDRVLSGTKVLPTQTVNYLAQVSADLPNVIRPTLDV